jgi:hypothetical protein
MTKYSQLQHIADAIDELEASHIITKCDSIYLWDTALCMFNTSQRRFNSYTTYIRNLKTL